ncbi:MAG: helix-hairpin-helix domain-containing protein, partial [Planctomycetaceae bacterium]|nr:helix-hairpin-helix domain-containing protein [Planctomycetaceae bacterium]
SASKKKKEKKNQKTTDTAANISTTPPDIAEESEPVTVEVVEVEASTEVVSESATETTAEVLAAENAEKTETEKVEETENVEAEKVETESVEAEIAIVSNTDTKTDAGLETITVENSVVESPDSELQDADVQAVTEQFQQWKEAQEEQGIPVIRSQKSLKKKKKEELIKKKDEAKNKHQEHFERQFSDYFDFTAGLRNFPAHRILAINRGERGKVLRVKIGHDEARLLDSIRESCVPKDHPHADFLTGCLKDALRRLVVPSIEREIRNDMTEFAERQAIRVFSRNLRHLLLQPPLYRKRVLALDPGYKHGCKMVPLDEFGNVLDFETVYLAGSAERKEKAVQKIVNMIQKYKISVIAVGNGSGSRETEELVSGMIASRFADTELAYVIVNESGASVYSASPIAKEEFPDYDPLLRGAVSIGRRLQDPLNELVKIDPASLGVGMYQHDLKNKHLKNTLTDVVESCVNFAGVDLNTATPAILRYVAGLNQMTAKRIHEYRLLHGPFRSRDEIKKVSGLGEVAFTHAAGFLKIHDGTNPLDATWIHPESYSLAAKILEKLGFSVDDLKNSEKVKEIAAKIAEEKIGELASRLATELEVGLFTVRDTLDDLSRPGRDPRESLPPPIFKKGILHTEDLTPGMELTGTVSNVVDFGAFVDIGLHDSGLVHISQMTDRFIRDAHEKVSVGDIVRVWVVEADLKRKRVSLTMRPPGTEKQPKPEHPVEPRRESYRNEQHHERSGNQPSTEKKPFKQSSEPRDPQQPENRRPEGTRPQNETPKSRDGNQAPHKDGYRQDNRNNRDKNRHNRGNHGSNHEHGNREHDHRNRPKSFVAAPKTKELKPISEKMKQGKEALRSFGDLAQFLGRVQITDPTEEKKRKKEEQSTKKESENS